MKSIFPTLAGAFLFLVAPGVVAPSQAASKEASPSPSASAGPTASALRPIPFTAKIFSVDKTAKTFSTQTTREKKIRVFAVFQQTKITKANNKPGTFDDLKPGEEVRGMVIKKGEGHFDVENVSIGLKEDPTKGAPSAAPAPAPSASPAHKKKSAQ